MKRVLKIKRPNYEVKYEVIEEYDGYAIYQETAPSGIRVHQSWAIVDLENDDPAPIIIDSYNGISKAEILDAIDDRNALGDFGFRVLWKEYGIVVDPCGDWRV